VNDTLDRAAVAFAPSPTHPCEPWFLRWSLLNGPEIAALDPEKTVVVLTCSPLEVHGPHLPTITDIIEGEGLLWASLRKVHAQRPELTFVTLPALWLATDVLPQTGSINCRPSTVRRALLDVGRSLAKQGFKHIWVSNFHGGPRHFVAIEVACNQVNRRYGAQMISIFSLLLSRLTRDGGKDLDHVLGSIDGVDHELLVGDQHGGFLETSMMLHLIRSHVAPHTHLPQKTLDRWAQEEGRKPASPKTPFRLFAHSQKYYEANTWAGAPGAATAELGEKFIDRLSDLTTEALVQLREGKLDATAARSPLWKMRHVLMFEPAANVFSAIIGAKTQVF
jgi:creatinine amidohydrolase